MKADIEQLEKAEQEMLMQLTSLDQIISRVDVIRKQVEQTSSMDEIGYRMKKWGLQVNEQRVEQLRFIMALDSICRIYRSCEQRIVEYSERSGQKTAFEAPQWNRISQKYITIFQKLGGK